MGLKKLRQQKICVVCGLHLSSYLALISPSSYLSLPLFRRGQSVSGHVVPDTSSKRIACHNELTARAWEKSRTGTRQGLISTTITVQFDQLQHAYYRSNNHSACSIFNQSERVFYLIYFVIKK